MRLILSRKGFDSQYGGCASPIFPGGVLASLPIPSGHAEPTFASLNVGPYNLGEVVQQLTQGRKTPVEAHRGVHLDPDIDETLTVREPHWRGAFGQVASAQGHLAGQGVEPGDVFLFFGWFRHVERSSGIWRYVADAPNLHVLFGWLQIGEIYPLRTPAQKRAFLEQHAWLRAHPHTDENWDPPNNTVYVARETLRLEVRDETHCGFGIFRRFDPALQLTWPGHSRCHWRLPHWFMPVSGKPALSYHPGRQAWKVRDGAVQLRSVGRGQEFVLDCRHYPQAIDWCRSLITEHG